MHTITRINELDAIVIEHQDFTARILLQGAQLTEFTTTQHPENWLFVSPANTYETGKAIRGGIPICWPVFGAFDKNPEPVKSSFPKTLEQHGYARHAIWTLESVKPEKDHISIALSLDAAQLKQSPKLAVQVLFTLSEKGFDIALSTTNNDTAPITFSQALHTYFATSDIHQTSITGFSDCDYVDALTPHWETKNQHGDITFTEETDRIYKTGSNCAIHTPNKDFELRTSNSNSTVVWNPWIEKSKHLSQFNDDDYLNMLCVETANALDDSITLLPKQTHTLKLQTRIIKYRQKQ